MYFTDRAEAGRLLAHALRRYTDKDVVVYALPRGGVVTGIEIARFLHAPIDLIITRKIGHPSQSEYAIAATAENGHIIGNKEELQLVNKTWLHREIENERREAKRRRKTYLKNREELPVKGKIAILVDDGIATGLTMRVGILELKHRHPKKIVVAIPVIPKITAAILQKEDVEVVTLDMPSDDRFLGAVGAYYKHFPSVEDEEVISMMQAYDKERQENTFSVVQT